MPLYKSTNIGLTIEHRKIILRRSIKILLHELCHLFGLKHCIYYLCSMNAANNEAEMNRQSLYLCPICLHKLYSTLQFDIRACSVFISVLLSMQLLDGKKMFHLYFVLTDSGYAVLSTKILTY